MVDLAKLAIGVDTTDLKRGEASLKAFQNQGARTEKAVRNIGGSMQRATSVNRNLGRAFQNTSFQIGDFATQIASGQRATTAFAQQFPQLAGGFGVWGAAIGAAVAVGAALVPLLFDMEGGARDLDDALSDLDDVMGGLKAPMDILKLSVSELKEQFGEAAQQTREFALIQAELAAAEAGRRLAEEIDLIDGALDRFVDTAGRDGRNALARIQEEFGLTANEAQELRSAFSEFENALGLDAQREALLGVLAVLQDNNVELSEVPVEIQEAISATITLQRETAAVAESMRQVAAEARNVPLALAAGGRGADPRGFEDDPYWRGRFFPDPERPRRTRRGGGGTDEFARDLERLTDNLRTEREIEEEWYQESQEILANRRAMEILGEQEHREALLRLEEEYQMRMRGVRQMEQSYQLSGTSDFFRAMERVASAGNDRLLQLAVAYGSTEAAVNTWRAHNATLADPSLPWWQRVPAALYVAGAGLKAANAISALGSSGGSGATGGAAGAAGGASNGETIPQTSQARIIDVQLSADPAVAELTRVLVRPMIEAINEEIEGGATIRLV